MMSNSLFTHVAGVLKLFGQWPEFKVTMATRLCNICCTVENVRNNLIGTGCLSQTIKERKKIVVY